MKLFHLSDLHIGKQLHGYSLIGDQIFILKEILGLIREKRPDVLLVAGDVYDKSMPPAEAVSVFDDFLTELAGMEDGPAVMIVSGNHDSQERLDFGSRLFSRNRIYIAGSAPGRENPDVGKLTLTDEEGEVNFYLLPFLRPSFVREIPGLEAVKTYEEAVRAAVGRMKPDPSERNVLVTHQFFTWAGGETVRSDSETVSVGGQDNVDVSAVKDFDYVAAGHIHGPQRVGFPHIRYCGSPLKYSVSEEGQEKSVTEVTLGKKGEVAIETIPLAPLHDVRRIEGTLAVLTAEETLAAADPADYVSAVLTDEEELYEPGKALRRCYPNLLEWKVDNRRTRHVLTEFAAAEERRAPMELFADFYQKMQGEPLSAQQEKMMKSVFSAAGGEKR